jgi:tetratricopeptide (TPR) repeat protein
VKKTTSVFRLVSVILAFALWLGIGNSDATAGYATPEGAAWGTCSPQPGSWFGASLSSACDVNGDGYADLLVGAPQYRSDKVRGGAVFVYCGSPSGFSASPVWMSCGAQAGEEYGYSVASAGDVNGDGFDDIIVGAPEYTGACTNEGRVCVFYGSAAGLSEKPNWTATGGQNDAEFGRCVNGAGDFNADKYADIIVGAPFAASAVGKTGRAAVFFGSRSGLAKTVAWEVWGEQSASRFGWSVSGAGDVNGDGSADVIVGAPAYSKTSKEDLSFFADLNLGFLMPDHSDSREGRAYLFQGNGKALGTNAAWIAEGLMTFGYFGSLVSGAGDVDGDKVDDVMIGASKGSDGRYREGFLSVYSGSSSGLAATASWTHRGTQVWTTLDHAGAPAGDVNGDGYADILMMYPFLDASQSDAGRVELYLGGKSGLGELPWWSMTGSTDCCWFGISATTVGDRNADGRSDIVIAQAGISNGLDRASLALWTNMVASPSSPRGRFVSREEGEAATPEDAFADAEQTRLDEKLDEAMAAFERLAPKLARDAGEHRNYSREACRSLWWLGRLQMRFGDLDSAIGSFEEAERCGRKELRHADDGKRLQAIVDVASVMGNRHSCLMELGKAAAARHVLDMLLRFREDMLCEDAHNNGKKQPSELSDYMMGIESKVAEQLLRAGKMDEYEKAMANLLQQAKSLSAERRTDWTEGRHVVKAQLESLAHFSCFFEKYADAVAYSEERVALPVREQYAFEDHLASVRHAKYLSSRDGASEILLEMASVALKKLRRTRDTGSILKGRITIAEILYDMGRITAARDMLDDLVSEACDSKYRQTRADAQVVRAKCLLKVNRPIDAARDCAEALSLRRALGLKDQEPEVYELYALALGASGQTALAIRTWNNAFDLCMSLNMHFRALHMLFGLAHLYLECGNTQEADRMWKRIDAFLQQHPNMPAPTMARYQKEKAAFVAFVRNHEQQLAARNDEKPVRDARVAQPEEAVQLGGKDGERVAPAPEGTAPIARGDNRAPVICPAAMQTQVDVGEYARARFVLYNPHADTLTGDLVLKGVATANWLTTGLYWTVDLGMGKAMDRDARSMSLSPGEARVVFLQSKAVSSKDAEKIALQWNGATNAAAEWMFETDGAVRETAIVNVSYEKTNPFFHSAFYHDIYYRGTTETTRNICVQTSVPCRIEFVNASTGRIMAVDANGDGDFEDAGDVLDQDLDTDGYPDFSFSRDHDADALELLVFPGAQDLGSADEIEVKLYVMEEGSWQHQGVDMLLLQ